MTDLYVFVIQAVSAHSEKIGAEEVKCKEMAENAQRDLDEALPALEEAMKVDLCLHHCLSCFLSLVCMLFCLWMVFCLTVHVQFVHYCVHGRLIALTLSV